MKTIWKALSSLVFWFCQNYFSFHLLGSANMMYHFCCVSWSWAKQRLKLLRLSFSWTWSTTPQSWFCFWHRTLMLSRNSFIFLSLAREASTLRYFIGAFGMGRRWLQLDGPRGSAFLGMSLDCMPWWTMRFFGPFL